MAAGNRYSTAVSLAKVSMSLGALALLSTLILFSRTPDPDAALPYADVDVQQLLRERRLSRPRFAGTLANGREVKLNADSAITTANDANRVALTKIDGIVNLSDSDELMVTAAQGELDLAVQTVDLDGSVVAVTLTGYQLTSDSLTIAMDTMRLTAPGPVTITSGGMTLDAGAMEMTGPRDGVFLTFTGGVRLILNSSD
jgi:lipopolysaccharide export system protein LptC